MKPTNTRFQIEQTRLNLQAELEILTNEETGRKEEICREILILDLQLWELEMELCKEGRE